MSRLSNDAEVAAEAASILQVSGGFQGAAVTDAAVATAVNPTAPVAFTVPLVAQAVPVVSEAATDLDTVAAALKVLHTETTSYEVAISALIVDVADIRAQLNALITSLEGSGAIA